ncbi:MAG: YbhN family protein [Salinirussus sp.]
MQRDRMATVAGFTGAIAILAVLVWFVGVHDILDALGRADPRMLAFVVVAAAIWLSAWGLSLWTVLRAIGAPIRARRAIFVFSAAMFSNNVTPFGQAGGEPVSALLISTASDTDYQTGLAAIASVDTLHFVPSIGLATVGFGFVALSAVELTRNVIVAALAVAGLATIVPLIAVIGWQNRHRIEAAIVRAFAPVSRVVGRVVPRVTPPDPADVEHRIESFFRTIERVAGDRRSLVTAMTFSAIGWISLSGALWLSLLAMGFSVPFFAALFVVPVGSIAGVTPLPGGLGGLEAAFIVLLSATTGIAVPVATAAVLIHRGATYWLPTLFGGGAAAVIGSWRRR